MIEDSEPNLARIPADGDPLAEAILQRAPDNLIASFAETLTSRDRLTLGRYGTT